MLDKPRRERSDEQSTFFAKGPTSRVPSGAVIRSLRAAAAALWPWRYRAPALAAIAILLWYFAIPALLGPVVIADPVIRADFVQTVVASGHVEAPFRVNIGSQIIGVVADVPVAEGQSVSAGDILVRLDDREARAAVVQAEGALAQAGARVRQMRELTLPAALESLQQAQSTLGNAQQAYDRASKLAKDGFGTQAKLDDAFKALEIAQAQSRSAELQVYTARPGGSDYVMVETQLNQAQASLASARSKFSYTVITAPRDGILISRDVERGNVVQPSNVLMKLSPSGDVQIVVQIDEKNLGLIAIGQPALWLRAGDAKPVAFRFADPLRPDAAETIARLRRAGRRKACHGEPAQEVAIPWIGSWVVWRQFPARVSGISQGFDQRLLSDGRLGA